MSKKCKGNLEECLEDSEEHDAWTTRMSLATIQQQKLWEKLNLAKVDKRKSRYKAKSDNPIPTDLEGRLIILALHTYTAQLTYI